MILNAYAVLDLFVVLLRCGVALIVAGLGCAALRKSNHVSTAGFDKATLEDRSYLLFSLALLLVGLNVLSWPLLYLFLQSMVSQWPGAMCVYGVTRIGAGSEGISRMLPVLVTSLEYLKPFQVFISGVWLVLYRINRRTETAPFSRRILAVQIALGLVTLTDGLLEVAYLAIPKREDFLSTGCCTAAYVQRHDAANSAIELMSGPVGRRWLVASYYCVNAGVLLSLWMYIRRGRLIDVLGTSLFTIASVPVTAAFMIAVAAPTVLHLPYHHCLYDLIPKAPDMLFGIGLFVWGIFSVGWAFTAKWLGMSSETRLLALAEQNRLLSIAIHCFLGSLLVTSLEMYLA